MKPEVKNNADVIIIGGGAAGLFTALSLAPRKVLILSEKSLGGICASCWAQAGIAASVGKNDSAFNHAKDTLKAGAGTSDAKVVDILTAEAPSYIKILEEYGVNFERNEDNSFKLSREACHDTRRVLKTNTGDGFGKELMRALVEEVKKTPSISFIGGVSAERIIKSNGEVQGVLARQHKDNESVIFAGQVVVLSTGGIGGLYSATTNPLGAVGRGVVMAAIAGAIVSDLEFVQYHPTALDLHIDPAPLATEALRGEGAYLLNSRGKRFMLEFDKMAELAPRDVVSRGIFAQMQKGQKIYLDCRHFDVSKFATLLESCKKANINPQKDLIPVMPAAHYHMGGIATDINGRTSINGLWACGEVAATGLHGANRLASNSLMEAIVMGGHVADDIKTFKFKKLNFINLSAIENIKQNKNMEEEKHHLRYIMNDMLGVVRSEKNMKQAIKIIKNIENISKNKDGRLYDMAVATRMIAISALRRKESRGGHYRIDYPQKNQLLQKRSFITLKEINIVTEEIINPITDDLKVSEKA